MHNFIGRLRWRRTLMGVQSAKSVLGRSDIVGKPMAMLLLNASATVTVCHSKTADLASFTQCADILVAAIGRPGFVTEEMVKPGAVLIDAGINRVTDERKVAEFFGDDPARAATFAKRGSVVVGDIHPAAFRASSAYNPVPGGVDNRRTVGQDAKATPEAVQRSISEWWLESSGKERLSNDMDGKGCSPKWLAALLAKGL